MASPLLRLCEYSIYRRIQHAACHFECDKDFQVAVLLQEDEAQDSIESSMLSRARRALGCAL